MQLKAWDTQSKWKHRETIGTEDELTAEEIKEADVVILAVDIAITGTERFEGKPTIKVPTNVCVKAPKKLIEKIENELGK